MDSTKTIIIRFSEQMAHYEIPLFRGAVLNLMKDGKCSVLFHNHYETGFRQSYPLIQYKRIGGKAAMVCIGEGTEVIGQFFASMQPTIALGDRLIKLEVESVVPKVTDIQIQNDDVNYFITKWLPLNSDNFKEYKKLEGVVAQAVMLERILVGNILSCAKGLGVFFKDNVDVKIIKVEDIVPLTFKDIKMLSFNIVFKTNVLLPDYIGLGKGASVGYGTISKKIR